MPLDGLFLYIWHAVAAKFLKFYRCHMTPEQNEFLEKNIKPLENMLLGHELGGLFTGVLYSKGNVLLDTETIEIFENQPLRLKPIEFGRLFMALDDSLVAVHRHNEGEDGTPAGVEVESDNAFIEEDELISVVAYEDVAGLVVRLNCLRLKRIVLDAAAPDRLATIAFGLMACTAYRLGFTKITLFAAGQGPIDAPDEMVGYQVWPKFGFDAELTAADLNAAPGHLRHCRSVLEVTTTDAQWWSDNGSSREMQFDLAVGSRSWEVLLDYIYQALAGDGL